MQSESSSVNVVKTSEDNTTVTTSARIFVGNLSYKTTWQDLKEHMKTGENIVYCDILKDFRNKSKGCALVEYESASDASAAIETLHDTMLDGRKIFVRVDNQPDAGPIATIAKYGVQRGIANTSSTPSSSVFIGNLPFDTPWQDLKDFLHEFNPAFVKVFNGYGIVKFQSKDEASRAIEELHGTTFNSRVLNVRFDNKEN